MLSAIKHSKQTRGQLAKARLQFAWSVHGSTASVKRAGRPAGRTTGTDEINLVTSHGLRRDLNSDSKTSETQSVKPAAARLEKLVYSLIMPRPLGGGIKQ